MKAVTNAPRRYTIAVDFDGVIHSYEQPFIAKHVIPDGPVPGALDWLAGMTRHFDVAIMSTRNSSWRGRRAMRRWLFENDSDGWDSYAMWQDQAPLGRVVFPKRKPPALAYLDDRALRFNGPGTFPTVGQIHDARPWNKRAAGGASRKGGSMRFVECDCCGLIMASDGMMARQELSALDCPQCASIGCSSPRAFEPAEPVVLAAIRDASQSEVIKQREGSNAV